MMARTVDCISARYPELAGKRVVVTGAASGIGLCFAQAFVGQGAKVRGIDNDRAAIEAVSKTAPADRIEFIEADLSTPETAIAAVEKAAGKDGIDVLIANAANDTRHNWHEVTPDLWRKTLGINLDHQFFAAQTAARCMVEHGGGLIVLMASVAWRRSRPAMVGYRASKAAVEAIARGLAHELGRQGVRVVGIAPGAIDTERQRRLWRNPENEAKVLADQAIPQLLDGWDVAALALFLASDGARGATAQTYVLDAGLS
jgi:NAD(P)-dependent dehydrogenase (short-subunit alcohol dehydrogenase family)